MPLPPYIAGRREADARDRDDYQTMFAREEGAVAAPTAALHFTPRLMAALAEAGIGHETLTLHVGAGTFLPVKADDTDDHVMHAEWGRIAPPRPPSASTPRARPAAGSSRSAPPRCACSKAPPTRRDGSAPFEGDTAIFITPGYRFRAVDGLVTNFHLPRSTLFMLVSALMGLEVDAGAPMRMRSRRAIASIPMAMRACCSRSQRNNLPASGATASVDFDAFPEGNPVPDLGRGGLGLGIIPGGVDDSPRRRRRP